MITIIGSLNYDLVTTAARIPDGGETVHASGFATHHGGKGANEALAARRLSPSDVKVAMVGCVGKDNFGDELVKSLDKEGVCVANITRSETRTGIATILVDEQGENRILVYSGANGEVTPDKITSALWKGSHYVMLQNEIPIESTIKVLKLASGDGVKTVYNPSPITAIDPEVYRTVDYLVVNAIEASLILYNNGSRVKTRQDAEQALGMLVELGVRSAVVITLGAEGSVFTTADRSEHGYCPCFKVKKVVDTTGAGDTFLAGLISQLNVGKKLDESVKFASKASAIVVTREGAASSMPKLDEVERFES